MRAHGGVDALNTLRNIGRALHAWVVPEQAGIPQASNGKGNLAVGPIGIQSLQVEFPFNGCGYFFCTGRKARNCVVSYIFYTVLPDNNHIQFFAHKVVLFTGFSDAEACE